MRYTIRTAALAARPLHAARDCFLMALLAAPLSSACGDSDDSGGPAAGAVMIGDANNYEATSVIDLPDPVETVAGDFEICWNNVTTDIRCDAVDPTAGINNVALLRFENKPLEEIERLLGAGEIPINLLDAYFEFEPPDDTSARTGCANLSTFSRLEDPIDVSQDYVQDDMYRYLLVFAEGVSPGVDTRTMTFVTPSESSDNATVQAPDNTTENQPSGCGALTFTPDLTAATPVAIAADGPWVIDWSDVTVDGHQNPFAFGLVDGLALGFYEGMTVAELQANVIDLDEIATELWETELFGETSADLSTLTERDTGAPFSGFDTTREGVWAVGMLCGSCQNPAPMVLSILEPE